MGEVQVDAHMAMLTVIAFNFLSFPFGIAVAATIRVGNLLGAGRPAAARAAGWSAVALGAVPMAACAVAMLVLRGRIALIFIDDPAVERVLATVVVWGAAAEVFDGVMGTAQVRCVLGTSAHAALTSCLTWFRVAANGARQQGPGR